MKHVGDITKIHGYDLEPVDCITGGSPCQDLSVAGKRAGLDGERSGLFMEQIRIVKEMRYPERYTESDKLVRPVRHSDRKPRYMVWENVPGAFSSGNTKGADFAAVIEEIIKIECEKFPTVQVPEGGWPSNGCFYDALGRWSIAWTVHDAQFWCVPQRRKRISLVADFGGLSAPEILFERKGLQWNSDESGETWENSSGHSEKSIGESEEYTVENRYGERESNGNRSGKLCLNSSGNDIAGTIDSNYFKGCGERECTEREFVSTKVCRKY